MSCKTCKDKSGRKPNPNDVFKQYSVVNKIVIWVIVIWGLLGLYGLYSLINKIIKKMENILLFFFVIKKELKYYIVA